VGGSEHTGHVSVSVMALNKSHCWDSDVKGLTLLLGECFVMCQINTVPLSSRIALLLVERDQVSTLFCAVWNTKTVDRVKICCRTDCSVMI
jgi:hypothetical protein